MESQNSPMKKSRKKLRTIPWNPVEYLNTNDRIVGYLEAALEDGDPALMKAVLADIAEALRLKSSVSA
jgi:DNA-binding phage protein